MRRLCFPFLLLILLSVSSSAQPTNQSAPIAALAGGVLHNSGEPLSEANPARPAVKLTPVAGMDFRPAPSDHSPFMATALPTAARTSKQADLLTFQGAFIKDLVRLNWSVRPGANVLGFAVERRSQTDEHWTTVRYIHATPRENTAGYNFYEHSPVNGVTYYRLRQVEQDGLCPPPPGLSGMPQRGPNSFIIWQHKIDAFTRFGALSFGLGSMMPVSVSIIDTYGRVAASLMEHRELESGHHIIPFATHSLPPGVYTLRMETRSGVQTRRLAGM